jgi:hypothetical protein
METAAQYAGLHKDTLYEWLKRGAREKDRVARNPRNRIREEERLFVLFSDAIKEALAQAEIQDVTMITQAAMNGAWQAAAWRLERKFPGRWGRKPIVEVTGKDGGPIQHEHDHTKGESREDQFERLFSAIDEYRADADASNSGAIGEQPMDPFHSNGKTA